MSAYTRWQAAIKARFREEHPEYGPRVFDQAAWDRGRTEHFGEACEDGHVVLHEKGAGIPMSLSVGPTWADWERSHA